MTARVLHRFPGGIRLEPNNAATHDKPARRIRLPDRLVLPLQQHVGIAPQPCVEPGQRVLKHDVIARAADYVGMQLHAPTSGTVSAIGSFPVIHPGAVNAPAIEITPDGLDEAAALRPAGTLNGSEDVYDRIRAAGIVGLGGAGFPSHVKVREGSTQGVETLIVNGVECEPYITCDDRTIRDHAAELVAGAALVARSVNARECIIAVEEDMPEARAALDAVADDRVEIVSVPAIYPAGGEKQLITVLTGKEVPSGMLPLHVQVAMLNVQTVLAIHRAVTRAEPLVERIVTVAGDIEDAGNASVLIGTPARHLLAEFGITDCTGFRVLSGGPMMGTRIADLDAPVTKTVNCVLLLREPAHAEPSKPCIRCGDCVPVCPVGLQPQQLYEAAQSSDLDAAQDFHLFDCIECGCCAYVCPSRIPLVHFYRHAKSAVEALDDDRARADQARVQFALHVERGAAADAESIELADIDGLDPERLKRDLDGAVERARNKRGASARGGSD